MAMDLTSATDGELMAGLRRVRLAMVMSAMSRRVHRRASQVLHGLYGRRGKEATMGMLWCTQVLMGLESRTRTVPTKQRWRRGGRERGASAGGRRRRGWRAGEPGKQQQ